MGETQIRRLVDGDRVGVGHPFFVVHDDALDSASADFGRGSGEVREGDRLGQRQVDRALKWFDHLLKRIPPGQIGVSVRDPSRATHLADQGARVRQGFSSRSIAAPSSCWPCAKPERNSTTALSLRGTPPAYWSPTSQQKTSNHLPATMLSSSNTGADRLEPTMTAEQHSSSVGSADRPACPTSLATSMRLTQCRDSLLTSAALPRPWAQADSSGL